MLPVVSETKLEDYKLTKNTASTLKMTDNLREHIAEAIKTSY